MIKKYLDKDSNSYYRVEVRIKTNGREVVRRKSKITSLSQAKLVERRLKNEALSAFEERISRALSWQKVTKGWANDYADPFFRSVSEETFHDYKSAIFTHTRGWDKRLITQITQQDGYTLLDEAEKVSSVGRVKRIKSAINHVYRWANYKGIISQPSVVSGYRHRQSEEDRMPESLSRGEIKRLLERAQALEHPWYPIWALALYTGMRSGELKALRWQNVDMDKRVIYVHENWTSKQGVHATKGRYWRVVSFDSDGIYSFLKELKVRATSQYVLPRFSEWDQGLQAVVLRDFCKAIGITPVKFHTLRACFATELLRDGVDTAMIMKVCGWKDLKTMQRYIRLAAVDVMGATKSLDFLPERTVTGKVFSLFRD